VGVVVGVVWWRVVGVLSRAVRRSQGGPASIAFANSYFFTQIHYGAAQRVRRWASSGCHVRSAPCAAPAGPLRCSGRRGQCN
jgi:hypothetical protein